MANPQIEDGHVDIANEIVEALAKIRISGEESQVLWVILRKTYGWHKKDDWISLSQFCLATGVKKPNVCRALSKLITKNIIIKKDNGNEITYQFQKDFDKWNPLSKKITLSKKIMPVIKKDKESLSKMIPTKENYTKETITKENISSDFVTFWNIYPKKVGKKEALKAWNKAKDKPIIGKIKEIIEKQKKSEQWVRDGGQYIPNPSTWINQGRWDDEVKEYGIGGQSGIFRPGNKPGISSAIDAEAERINEEWRRARAAKEQSSTNKPG